MDSYGVKKYGPWTPTNQNVAVDLFYYSYAFGKKKDWSIIVQFKKKIYVVLLYAYTKKVYYHQGFLPLWRQLPKYYFDERVFT